MRQQNSNWGKLRIAQEMAKENNWVAIVSPNTVRRILRTAALWSEEPKPGRKKASGATDRERLNSQDKLSISIYASFRFVTSLKSSCLR
jgi:hypothetical protein